MLAVAVPVLRVDIAEELDKVLVDIAHKVTMRSDYSQEVEAV